MCGWAFRKPIKPIYQFVIRKVGGRGSAPSCHSPMLCVVGEVNEVAHSTSKTAIFSRKKAAHTLSNSGRHLQKASFSLLIITDPNRDVWKQEWRERERKLRTRLAGRRKSKVFIPLLPCSILLMLDRGGIRFIIHLSSVSDTLPHHTHTHTLPRRQNGCSCEYHWVSP